MKTLFKATKVLIVVVIVVVAYCMGELRQASIFLSGHLYWHERYSTALARLAREGNDQELRRVVLRFDTEWKKDTQSVEHLRKVVIELVGDREFDMKTSANSHGQVTDETFPAGNRRSAPRQPLEGPPPAKPGSAPR